MQYYAGNRSYREVHKSTVTLGSKETQAAMQLRPSRTDVADRLNSMLSGSISASISKFHPHGNPEEILFGNGVKETWTYNKRLQVQGISTTKAAVSLLGITYEYGLSDGVNNGNVTKQTIVPPGTANFVQEYLYDDLNRLKNVSETTTVPGASGWSRAFHYDRYGNLGMDSAAALNQYNAGNNRIEKDASGNALSPYPYDAMGNIVNHPTLGQMKFDQAGRLRETVVLGKTVTYDYDGEGRRVKRNYSGLGTTYYVYDGEGQLAAEYGVSDPMLCTVCYLSSDALGSTRLMTDGSGAVKQRTDHLPFGDVIPANNTNGGRQSITDGQAQTTYTLAGGPTQKFTGKERDAETGLDYFGARYMSSAQGRFTSPDAPFVDQYVYDPQSWNLYSYVRSSPLARIDPTGRCSKKNGSDQATDDPDEPCVAAGDTTVTVNDRTDEVPLFPVSIGGSGGAISTVESAVTTSNESQLNSDQCRAIRIVLSREAQYGTPRAARMSGNTLGDGTLEPLNSTFVPNIKSPLGEIDVDWFTDLKGYSAGFSPVVYPIAKSAWTLGRLALGVPIGNPFPFQDAGERNAVLLSLDHGYRDIFTASFMQQACKGK